MYNYSGHSYDALRTPSAGSYHSPSETQNSKSVKFFTPKRKGQLEMENEKWRKKLFDNTTKVIGKFRASTKNNLESYLLIVKFP